MPNKVHIAKLKNSRNYGYEYVNEINDVIDRLRKMTKSTLSSWLSRRITQPILMLKTFPLAQACLIMTNSVVQRPFLQFQIFLPKFKGSNWPKISFFGQNEPKYVNLTKLGQIFQNSKKGFCTTEFVIIKTIYAKYEVTSFKIECTILRESPPKKWDF